MDGGFGCDEECGYVAVYGRWGDADGYLGTEEGGVVSEGVWGGVWEEEVGGGAGGCLRR